MRTSRRDIAAGCGLSELAFDLEVLDEAQAAAEDLMLAARLAAGMGEALLARGRRVLGGALDEALGDERAGDGGAEEVVALVDGVGLEHREDVVFRELFRQVFDVGFDGARGVRFFMQPVQFLFLPDVRAVGDDFGVVCLLQPLEDAGRVQTAGICEYDFHGDSPCVG